MEMKRLCLVCGLGAMLWMGCGPKERPDELVGSPPQDDPTMRPKAATSIMLHAQDQPKDAKAHQAQVDKALSERGLALSACLNDPNSDFRGETLTMWVSFELSAYGEPSKMKLEHLPVAGDDPIVPCMKDALMQTTFPFHPDKLVTQHQVQLKVKR